MPLFKMIHVIEATGEASSHQINPADLLLKQTATV